MEHGKDGSSSVFSMLISCLRTPCFPISLTDIETKCKNKELYGTRRTVLLKRLRDSQDSNQSQPVRRHPHHINEDKSQLKTKLRQIIKKSTNEPRLFKRLRLISRRKLFENLDKLRHGTSGEIWKNVQTRKLQFVIMELFNKCCANKKTGEFIA